MSKGKVRNHVYLERNNPISFREREKPSQGGFISSKHLKRVYPLGIHKSSSSLSLSSNLSLSQNSNDSSLKGSIILGDWKIPVRRREVLRPPQKTENLVSVTTVRTQLNVGSGDGSLNRCHWITKSTDEVYVHYHDECWGVPVYDD
ncbi:hypothetical protein BVC80_1215g25 [Macleaya cordata]|uniref:DNA-3-methyladenine glycosylase I n=1 Tax=Macleaya cordata TaxID=56857 RepID=A0A200Q370_MACCD|nr:hypothetical protein BVC80_1215g25 [Macleaya cordata]